MKPKIILSLAIAVLFTVFAAQAQKKAAQTTQEEYDYMTKGYASGLSSGMDVKQGYAIGTAVPIKQGNFTFTFMPLVRTASGEAAGYIVKEQSGSKTAWYGISFGNAGLVNYLFFAVDKGESGLCESFFKAYVSYEGHTY